MKIRNYLTFLFFVLAFQIFAQTKEEQDAGYTKTITIRAEKIVAPLGITDTVKSTKVRDIIVQQSKFK
jgi:hypothetical protein